MIDKTKLHELSFEELRELVSNVLEAEDKKMSDAKEKASAWLNERNKMLTLKIIIDAVEVAQMAIAEDMRDWDEMDDSEKDDLAELMCGLMVARDLIADMFGMPTEGRIERDWANE